MSIVEWTPVNEAEAELLKAFNALGDTPGTGIVEGEAEEDKQFILSTRGYYGTLGCPGPRRCRTQPGTC